MDLDSERIAKAKIFVEYKVIKYNNEVFPPYIAVGVEYAAVIDIAPSIKAHKLKAALEESMLSGAISCYRKGQYEAILCYNNKIRIKSLDERIYDKFPSESDTEFQKFKDGNSRCTVICRTYEEAEALVKHLQAEGFQSRHVATYNLKKARTQLEIAPVAEIFR